MLLVAGPATAIATPVVAADVKFSGSGVVQGYDEDNRKLSDPEGRLLSNMWQRLRVGAVLKVAEA